MFGTAKPRDQVISSAIHLLRLVRSNPVVITSLSFSSSHFLELYSHLRATLDLMRKGPETLILSNSGIFSKLMKVMLIKSRFMVIHTHKILIPSTIQVFPRQPLKDRKLNSNLICRQKRYLKHLF